MTEAEKRPVTAQDVLHLLERIEYSYNGMCPLCRCEPQSSYNGHKSKDSVCPVVTYRERIRNYGIAP